MQIVLMSMMLMMHPGHETTGCGAVYWDGTDEVSRSEDETVLAIIRRIRQEQEIELPIVLCESSAGAKDYVPIPASHIHEDVAGVKTGYVHIPRQVIEDFSPSALIGLTAHEMAHLVLPRDTDCTMMRFRLDPVTNEERVACETPADAKAIEWTDRGAVQFFLYEIGKLLEPYSANEELTEQFWKRIQLRSAAIRNR